MNCKYKVKIKRIQYNYRVQMAQLQGKYKFNIFCTGGNKELEEKVNTLYEAWPRVSGTGETITLNDTVNTTMAIDLKGNTSQATTTGSQLIDFATLGNANTTNSFTNDVLTVNTSTGTYSNAFKDITSIYKSNPSKVLRFDFTSLNSTTTLSGAVGYVRLRIVKTDNSVTNVNLVNTDKSISNHTIPNDTSNISTVSLTIYANNTNTAMTNTVTINKPILHFGSVSTDYEPYTNGASPNPDYPQNIHVVSGDNTIIVSNSDNTQSQSYPINLGNIELCKIGDYQDSIVKDNGKWYLNKQIGKVVLDGSESWSLDSSNSRFYSNSIITDYDIPNRTSAKSDYYTYAGTPYFALSGSGNILFLGYPTSSISTLADFKIWLGSNKPKVYYVLATPTTTEITDSTLLSQLEAIKEAESYSGQTNISQTNDDKPFILTAKALKDLSNL